MRNLNYILIAVACWHTEEFCVKWDALFGAVTFGGEVSVKFFCGLNLELI